MTPDIALLRQYAKSGDEAAFTELVRRQVNLVYSVALRLTGNAALAQDVAQTVFTDLARKAGPLSHHETLAGWLHTSTRFAALKALRGEIRRQTHEQEAATMPPDSTNANFDWERLSPVLDEAVGRLRAHERDVVVLRFFSGLSHREIGATLGLNENTARKRVDHALEKLRTHFARSGITVSSALLASAITTNSIQAAPIGMAQTLTGPALSAGTVKIGAVSSSMQKIFLMSTKTKIAAVVVVLAVVGVSVWWFMQPLPVKVASAVARSSVHPNLAAALPKPMLVPSPPAQSPPPQEENPVPAPADPQADLRTALPDMARLIRSGGLQAMRQAYGMPGAAANVAPSPPPPPGGGPAATGQPRVEIQMVDGKEAIVSGADQLSPQQLQNMQQQLDDFNSVETQNYEALAETFESLTDETPAFNAAGDEAVYKYIRPALMLDSNDAFETPATPEELIMVRMDGKWYLKQDIQNYPKAVRTGNPFP